MTASEGARHDQRVRRLVEDEPVGVDDQDVLGPLERLCRVARRELDAAGVGVSLMWGEEGRVLVAASDDVAARLEEVQFLVGEGPCWQAYADGGPVVVPDLSTSTRFPAYGVQALALGVRAVFAFPIWAGEVCVGVLDVYRTRTAALDDTQTGSATLLAALAQELLTVIQQHPDGGRMALEELGLDSRDDIFMAQGMVMVQLQIGSSEAMVRLRAAAFASDRPLLAIARSVLARELVLDAD